MTWVWIIIAVLYILSPYDLLPDFIPVRGWIDDLIVGVLLFRYLPRFLARRRFARQQAGSNRTQADDPPRPENKSERPRDPYEVLGLSPGASQEQIQKAYRRLVNQYHPDKVAHLGREFQALAEERFKEIQRAYQQLRGP